MHRTGAVVQPLGVGQGGDHRKHIGCAHLDRRGDRRQRSQRFLEALDPAEPTTDGTRHTAATIDGSSGSHFGERHTQLDAEFYRQHLDGRQFSGITDDALGEREAEAEIFEVERCGHHHGVGRAIVGERYRHLFGQHALPPAARHDTAGTADRKPRQLKRGRRQGHSSAAPGPQ